MFAEEPLNIIICGVGGQGNILASELISQAAFAQGYQVSVGETLGVTQRGGSVQSHLRLSKKGTYGPLIPKGKAHIIVGFEPLEVFRLLGSYGQDGVRVVMNHRPAYPVTVLQKKATYPSVAELMGWIENLAAELKVVPATQLASQAGNPLAQNVVMVGALAALEWIPVQRKWFLKIIDESFFRLKA